MSFFASELSYRLQARRGARRARAPLLVSAASTLLLACATYESPAVTSDGAGGGSSGGSSAGGEPATGDNLPSSSTAPTGGKAPMPITQAGSAGMAGSVSAGTGGGSGGGAAGSAGAAGGGGQGGAGGAGGSGGASGAPTCAECASLKDALVHRYDFEGTGAAVVDRVGTAHGTVQGGATLATVAGKGVVNLGGGAAGAYVDLPNGLLSSLTNATLEAWVTWSGGDPWQRIFDFGDSTATNPEDAPENGKSYLFLTPMTDAGSGGVLRAVYSLDGGSAAAETRADGGQAMPLVMAQVVVVVDATAARLSVYLDGEPSGWEDFNGSLASINDVNAWLGRSQYNADAELSGTFHDFRVYDAALTAAQIRASFVAGPDPAFLAE